MTAKHAYKTTVDTGKYAPVPDTILFLVILAAGLVFAFQSLLPAPPHGDEGHYLLMTVSLLQDGDLDLKNNYGNEDYKAFTSLPMVPHRSFSSDDHIYSAHAPALSAILTLPYRVGGRTGVTAFMVLIGTLAAFQIRFLGTFLGLSAAAARWTALGTGISLPWIMMSGMVYPEIIAGFCLITALNLFMGFTGIRWWIAGTLCLAVMPWLHIKFAVLAVAGYMVFLARRKPYLSGFFLTALPAAAAAVLLLWFQNNLFGDPMYLTKMKASGFGNPMPGLAGLLVDREAGLLVYGPFYLLTFMGVPWLKKKDRILWMLTGIILLQAVISAGWVDWHGGHCPPARYLVPVLPLMSVLAGVFLTRRKGVMPGVVYTLAMSASLVQVWLVLKTIPENVIVHGNGVNRLWEQALPIAAHWIPSLLNPGHTSMITAVSFIAVVAGVAVLLSPASDRRAVMVPAWCLIVVAVGFTISGVQRESQCRVQLETTLLSVNPTELLEPHPGSIWIDAIPDLKWRPVSGADGYEWEIRFPDGYQVRSKTYGKTKVELPDSMASMLPEGRYQWTITPLKGGIRGVTAEPRSFTIQHNQK